MITERMTMLALVVSLVLVMPPTASAAGADDDYEGPLAAVTVRIGEGDYAGAIAALDKLLAEHPDNADVLNLLGYSHRLSGDLERALDYYQRALALEPKHLGANEYLGELYLQLDDLAGAQARLAVLDDACFFGSDEYTELKTAIAEYRAARGLD